jgi:hypothetical protein
MRPSSSAPHVEELADEDDVVTHDEHALQPALGPRQGVLVEDRKSVHSGQPHGRGELVLEARREVAGDRGMAFVDDIDREPLAVPDRGRFVSRAGSPLTRGRWPGDPGFHPLGSADRIRSDWPFPRSLRGNRNRAVADVRKVRQLAGCNRPGDHLALHVRRRGQPSRSKPGGRAVEVTRKSVRPGDERPAGAANLFNPG